MSAEKVAQAMIQKRQNDGMALDQAYDHAISTIDEDVRELDSRARELRKKLEDNREPEEYVKRLVGPFYLQIELQMYLLLATRQLRQDGWRPNLA